MELHEFFGKDGPVAKLWNSPLAGVPLWLWSAVYVVRWHFNSPSPGKAIGALAVVAGLMSVRDIKALGKILWVNHIGFPAVTEFHSIDEDRAENDRKNREFFAAQQTGFAAVTDQAEADFAATAYGLDAAWAALNLR